MRQSVRRVLYTLTSDNNDAAEGEMLQYPMSLLSASALIEGGIEALIAFYESDAELIEGRGLNDGEITDLEDKAHLNFAGVIEDIKDLFGFSKVIILQMTLQLISLSIARMT